MQDPVKYESNKSAPGRDTRLFVPKLIAEMSWNNNETILDYGCGAGSVAAEFFLPLAKKYSSKIYAVDCSERMIEYAREHYSDPNIEYSVGNIMNESWAQNSFARNGVRVDKIFSIYVLHLIRDHRTALQKFFELLNPNGQFGFTVAINIDPPKVLPLLLQNPTWSPFLKNHEQYIPDWQENQDNLKAIFRKTLNEFGFRIKKLETHQLEYEFDFEVYIELCMSLNPFLSEIPSALHPQLKMDYRQILAKLNSVDPYPPNEKITKRYSMLCGLVLK